MASFVSDSIFAGLKAQFEDAMRSLVQKIAEGEGLDEDELMAKYLVNVIPATKEAKGKAPAKPRKAKVTVTPATDENQKCCCLTAKGKPCALKPLFGTTMCRVHTKKAEADGTVATGSATGPIKEPKPKPAKEKKAKKPKKVKSDAPVHTHELDDEDHDDCELCQSHGNPLHEADNEEEFETVSSPRRSLRERLMRVAETEEFVDEDDEA